MFYNHSNGSDVIVYDEPAVQHGNVDKPLAIQVLSQIYRIAIPVICVTGVLGNTLAFFVFVSKPMRRTSCSLYLAARSITDGGFLTTTFIPWSSDVSKTHYYHTDGLCQVTIFLSSVFAFLSVWFTVVITSENYIRICRPFSVSNFCNVPIAKRAILVLVFISLVMYNYPLWTTIAHDLSSPTNVTYKWCSHYEDFAGLIKWLSFWDLLITLIIPSLIIIFLMVAITVSLVNSIKRQSRLQQSGSSNRGQSSASGNRGQLASDLNGNASTNGRQPQRSRSSSSPQAKVTRMLFLVSLLFIILNSPSHIIRTKMAIEELYGVSRTRQRPTTEELCQVAFQIVHYMSFGVNLLVYLICGDSFRKVFQERYMSLCLRRSRRFQPEMTALTTVRLEETDRRPDDQMVPIHEKGRSSVESGSPVKGDNAQNDYSGKAAHETKDLVVTLTSR